MRLIARRSHPTDHASSVAQRADFGWVALRSLDARVERAPGALVERRGAVTPSVSRKPMTELSMYRKFADACVCRSSQLTSSGDPCSA